MSSGQGQRPDDPRVDTLLRMLGEVTADLATYVEWEAASGATGWPRTPREKRVLPDLGSIMRPAEAHSDTTAAATGRRAPTSTDSPRAAGTRPAAAPGGRAAVSVTEAGSLEELRELIGPCQRCPLAEGRTNLVFGDGSPEADLLFVGEGPGFHEDKQGLPFVGAAGALLNRIIQAIGLTREQTYICNIVKCRPPRNRDPEESERTTCRPFVERQIELIRPKVIVGLGRVASQTLLGTTASMGSLRGRFHDYCGIPFMPTYHPAALLRNEQLKRPVWDDMKQVMAKLAE